MKEIIKVEKVSKTFRVPKKEEGLKGSFKNLFLRKYEDKVAVDNISFTINEGEFIGFIGPNGAGKTTTIKMLSGIIHTDKGIVKVMDYVPQQLNKEFKMKFSVILGQKNQLWWDIPAIDSFNLYKEIYQIPEERFRKNIKELSELLDVSNVLNVPVRNLSLGERMKLEIISALLHNPKVLFLDEPTIGLDVFSRRKIRDFLKIINKEKKITIILTSHYIEDIKALCSRIIGIKNGKIVYDGPFERIGHEFLDTKRISIAFEGEVLQTSIEKYGSLVELSGNRATFLVKKNQLKEFGSMIFANENFYDLNIEDVPVDEIFEKLFNN